MSLYNDGYSNRAVALGMGIANGAASREIDWTIALGLSLQFEVVAAIVTAAVFQVWSDIPAVGNPLVGSGVSGNQALVSDDDLYYPLTGAPEPMVVTIPPTAVTTGLNVQGFTQTNSVSPVGSFTQGRPRCLGSAPFIFVKAISGDTANINVTALLSRLKYVN